MKKILLLVLCIVTGRLSAQDPQFSQYYSAPLMLNPALTGATDCYRVGMNARSQWAGLQGRFNTASLFADLNYPDVRSGFGIIAVRDDIGIARLQSTELSGLYSFHAPFSEMFNLRLGLQGTYVSRSIDYSRLLFEDQFSGTNVAGAKTHDPTSAYARTNYADFSTGMLVYGEDKYWVGFAAHHINRPDQGFYLEDSRLPVKYSLHGGYNFVYRKPGQKREEDWTRIIPTFLYKAQRKFDQLDLGVYFIKEPFTAGLWYRGIFLKEDESIRNNDAIILQAGIHYRDFSFMYSYDITTSKLRIGNTKGSHEISVVYLFCLDWPPRKKPSRKVRRLPCPDFQKPRY
jgi:type IX secretion system PorP/SprF family membrane protein